MSKWLTHLKAFYLEKKKTDKSYSYKNAMKDAAKTYNAKESNSESCTAKSTKMRKLCTKKRRTQRKTRK